MDHSTPSLLSSPHLRDPHPTSDWTRLLVFVSVHRRDPYRPAMGIYCCLKHPETTVNTTTTKMAGSSKSGDELVRSWTELVILVEEESSEVDWPSRFGLCAALWWHWVLLTWIRGFRTASSSRGMDVRRIWAHLNQGRNRQIHLLYQIVEPSCRVSKHWLVFEETCAWQWKESQECCAALCAGAFVCSLCTPFIQVLLPQFGQYSTADVQPRRYSWNCNILQPHSRFCHAEHSHPQSWQIL